MTETRTGQFTPFKPFEGHRAMTAADGEIFLFAAEAYVHPEISQAIRDAGGDLANIYHFGREVCGHCPITPWAQREDHETVVAMLRKVGEGLKG